MAAENTIDSPIAVAGYKQSAGSVNDDWLAELNGPRGRKAIRQMVEGDELIGGFMLLLTSLVRTTPVYVDPVDALEPEAVKYADWLRDVLFRHMRMTWDEHTVYRTEGYAYGWSWFHVQTQMLPDGTRGIAKLMPVAQETLDKWIIPDELTGEVTGIVQQAPNTYKLIPVPLDQSLHFIPIPNKGSPEGKSILRHVHRSWRYKCGALEQEAIIHERGCGFPVLYVSTALQRLAAQRDATTGELTPEAVQAAALIRTLDELPGKIKRNQASGLTLFCDPFKSVDPQTGEITFTNMRQVELQFVTPDSTPTDIDKTIRRHNADIARALMADFMLLGSGGEGSGGNRSLSGDKMDLFARGLQGLLEGDAETYNRQLVPMLWKLNGFPEQYAPRLRFGEINRKGIEQVVGILETLSRAGAPVFPDDNLQAHIYAEAGLPMPQTPVDNG